MKILIVSGIFPPDIGGPATHAANMRAELVARGHTVTVLALTAEARPTNADGVVRFPRSWPWPLRSARILAWIARSSRRFDLVYATGLGPLAVAGARLGRRPVILKIVGDPAWERGARRGLTTDSFDSFQAQETSGAPPTEKRSLRAMRWLRNWSTRNATLVVTPSEHLGHAVERWSGRDDVVIVPNGAKPAAPKPPTEGGHTSGALQLLYVGRLVPLKRVELLIAGVARTSSTRLDVVGEGPDLQDLQALTQRLGVHDRVRFVGALDHDAVMERLAAADALVLASTHEGLPHVVLEALVSGKPIVSTAVGGVTEILADGVDCLLVDPTPEAFADAFTRLTDEPGLLARLSAAAEITGAEWRFERCADRLESLFRTAVEGLPRAVFVGRTRTAMPPTPDDERKYALHRSHLETIVLCTGAHAGVVRPSGATVLALPQLRPRLLGTAVFYLSAPVISLALTMGRPRGVVSCQSPYVGAAVLALRRVIPPRYRPRVQIELHGDWTTAMRMYGSPRRRFFGSLADGIAEWALRRADRVRAVSQVLEGKARDAGYTGPIDRFVTFSDFQTFFEHPRREPPEKPRVLFVGVLERYKAVDILLDAWPAVVREVPEAQLTIVGDGGLRESLHERVRQERLGGSVQFLAPVPRTELRELLDASSCLVLQSRSEGLARIVIESMARARPVVASRVGGIEEVIEDGTNGRLVPVEDAEQLASALVEVLRDPERARRMGEESLRRALARDPLAEYAAGIERFAAWI